MAKKSKQVDATGFDDTRKVTDDPIFIKFVTENVEALIDHRVNRPKPKKGMYYKRTWYDKLDDLDGVSSTFFLANINDIWLKKSNLSSDIRAGILSICNHSVIQTLQFYQAQGEKEPKPNKNGKANQ